MNRFIRDTTLVASDIFESIFQNTEKKLT